MNSRIRSFSSFVVFLFLAACGGGGGGSDPTPPTPDPNVPDVAGTWEITENHNDDCDDGNLDVWMATVTQNGASVTVTYGGVSRTGTLNGNVLTWSGSYDEPEGGTTTVSSLTLTFSGDSASGSAEWSWSNGVESCSGTTSITAQRVSSGATVPDAPTGLNAVSTSSGSINLMWQDNADNEDAYTVERSEVSSTTGFNVVATLPADSQSFSDSGLSPATTYYYRVAASNSEGPSAYSNVANATTDAAAQAPPAAPTNLNGSATSSTSVNLFWTDSSDNESGFEIYQALAANGLFALAQSVSANVTSASVTGLSPATTYAFKVVAVNSAGSSPDSNIHEIATPADDIPPNPPSALTVGNPTSSSLTLNWTDNSDNETGFRIYRSDSQNGNYIEIFSTPDTSYTNTGLSDSTTYWYRVSAFNNAGESALTAPVSGTTSPPPLVPPDPPSGLTVGNPTHDSLTLSWTDNSNNESGFHIYRSSTQAGTYSRIATAPATSYTDTGLNETTTYWYKVSAFNDAGESPQTAPASGTTLATPVDLPTAPTNPTVSNVTENSATLSWTDNSDNESGFQIGTCAGLVLLGTPLECLTEFTQVDEVGANVTSYTFTGLSPNTEYLRFVRAFNTAGVSENTGTSFTTALGPQTVTLRAINSNAVIKNSLDSTVENKAFPNSFPSVGTNWGCNLAGTTFVSFAGLVKYDISSLLGRTIDSATLNLEVNVAPVGFLPQDFHIGTVATPWNPTTVTWNMMATFQFYNAGWQFNIPNPVFAGQTYSIDLTSVVQGWADKFFDNNGLGFISADYFAWPGVCTSLDAYEFFVPTLTVNYH